MNDTKAESSPLQSFAEFYASEIAPGLPALEAQRRDRLRKATVRAVGLGFVVAAVVAAAFALPEYRIVLAVLVVLGLAAGAWWVTAPARRHREALRELVVEPLRRHLGGPGGDLDYHRKPGHRKPGHHKQGGRFDLGLIERSGIVGGFNRSTLEDLLSGRHRGTGYRMVEARLRRRSGGKRRSSTTVFKGLLCSLSVPVAFKCRVLLVGEPFGGMGGKLGNRVADFLRDKFTEMSPVPLDHGAFEDRFQVYSDDPAAARQLLQPGLLDSLLAIADDAGRDAVNCGFLEGRFVIAIPQAKDLFEIGRLTRSLDYAEEDIRRLASEFTIPQRLIDTLHGERVAVLGGG
jgi:hypothetical protein